MAMEAILLQHGQELRELASDMAKVKNMLEEYSNEPQEDELSPFMPTNTSEQLADLINEFEVSIILIINKCFVLLDYHFTYLIS